MLWRAESLLVGVKLKSFLSIFILTTEGPKVKDLSDNSPLCPRHADCFSQLRPAYIAFVNWVGGGRGLSSPVRSCLDPPVKGKEVMRHMMRDMWCRFYIVIPYGIFHAYRSYHAVDSYNVCTSYTYTDICAFIRNMTNIITALQGTE